MARWLNSFSKSIAGLAVLFASSTSSQELETLDRLLKERLTYLQEKNVPNVGSTFGVPSGTTLSPKSGFLSGSVASLPGGGSADTPFDASAAIGYGIPLGSNLPSLDVYLGITSVNPKGADGGFGIGEDGNISLKSTIYKKKDTALAIGANNVVAWGEAKKTPQNTYMAYSKAVRFDFADITTTLGYGTAQSRAGDAGGFIGLGISSHLLANTSYGISYNVDRWMAGVNTSISLFDASVSLSFGFDDVLDELNARRVMFSFARVF